MIVQNKLFLWLIIVYCFGHMLTLVDGINILGIVTSPSRSNNHHAAAIFNELANSGHSVTVLSPYQQSQKINHYELTSIIPREQDKLKKRLPSELPDSFSDILKLYYEGIDRVNRISIDPSFQKLITTDMNIDVIIFDYDYNEALLGLGEVFNCPVILLTVGRLNGLTTRSLGLPYPLHNIINVLHDFNRQPFEIVKNLLLRIFEEIFIDFIYTGHQETLYKQIFPGLSMKVPFHDSYHKSIVKIFISTLSEQPILKPINMIDVTGIHIPFKNFFEYSFPKKLDDFIYSAENGCIYISFGADVNPFTLPKDKINTIFRLFYNRPEKVIWAWNGNTSVFGSSPDFYFDRWLPQNEILQHDNVKLFITNGGELSVIEAIHHEIPIIGIPLTNQQSRLLDDIEEQGLGIKLDLENVTIGSLTWALGEIFDNNRFHENLMIKSEKLEDQPMTPMKTMKFWLNYVYRHRHTLRKHRQQQQQNQHWRKFYSFCYYFFDVYLILFIILVTAIISFIVLVKFMQGIFSRILFKRKLKLY